jgi:Phage Mu protein F like protein
MKRRNEKVLRAVHPNLGIQYEYQEKLRGWMALMHKSIMRFVIAAYRANEPVMAQDAVPANELQKAIRKLVKRWKKNFNEAAPELAKWFAMSASRRSDKVLAKILKDAGITVKFTMTKAQRDVLRATVHANVSLIKSIPTQYLNQVEGIVMRSVQTGMGIGPLAKELEKSYGVTKRRAALIARDQNLKATASLNRARQIELGVTDAIWMHSHGGNEPRPTHVKMDGKRYSLAKGMWDSHEKKWIQVGQLINCFPGNTIVRSNCMTALWRTAFHGPMVHVDIGTDLLQCTPNHPILTNRGWIAAQVIQRGDYVVCMCPQGFDVIDNNKNCGVSTFTDVFEAASIVFGNVRRQRTGFDFHGDLPDDEVDEVIVDFDLFSKWKFRMFGQQFRKLHFTESDGRIHAPVMSGIDQVFGSDAPGFFNVCPPVFGRHFPHSQIGGFRTGSRLDIVADKQTTNACGPMFRHAEFGRDCGRSHSVFVHLNNLIGMGIPAETPIGMNTNNTQFLADIVRSKSNDFGHVFQHGPAFYEFRRVCNKFIRDCSGHVFTMETSSGHYGVGNTYIQAKNCKCVSKSVIKGFS